MLRLSHFAALIAAVCALLTGAATYASDTILVFGDSLSAGYGLARGQAWPDLLAARLTEQGYDYKVVNASVSGETTAGGRNRIAQALDTHHPQVVIIELGANDGLRGAPPGTIRANLDAMIGAGLARKARVLVVGMRLPPNYGTEYPAKFQAVFSGAANRHGVTLVPFLFEGIAADPAQFQADGLHPNAAAQPRLLDNVWGPLKTLLAPPHAGKAPA